MAPLLSRVGRRRPLQTAASEKTRCQVIITRAYNKVLGILLGLLTRTELERAELGPEWGVGVRCLQG